METQSLNNLLNELYGRTFVKLDPRGLQNPVLLNAAPFDLSPGSMIDDFWF